MPELLLALFTTGAVNSVYGIILISLIIVILWQWLKIGKIYINGMTAISFYVFAIFAFGYVLFGEFSIQGVLYYFFCPLAAYLAGWTIVEISRKDSEKAIKQAVTAILLGYAVHAALNNLTNIGHQRWELTDFFSGSLRGATGSGCINTLAFSLFAYFIVLEKQKTRKALGLICGAVSLMYAFLLGTRTQFIILLLVSFAFLSCYFYERFGVRSVAILLAVVVLLIVVFGYLYTNNVLGVKEYVDTSNLMARYQVGSGLSSSDDYRISSVTRGIKNLFEYPLGGLKETSYYHNFWLDIGRIAGIIPVMCMLCYTILTNFHLVLIVREKSIQPAFRYLLFCVYLGIQINFFVEPVLEGLLDFFFIFMVINGMVECYYCSRFGSTGKKLRARL